jgi:hypothetical protein
VNAPRIVRANEGIENDSIDAVNFKDEAKLRDVWLNRIVEGELRIGETGGLGIEVENVHVGAFG